jgi:serine phosphatase RsbU (regulator of sigma subunit)
MRRARRSGASLLEIADEVSNSITTLGDDGNFVSGVMLEIDTTTWEGTWISAGHQPPLLVDDHIAQFDLRPALPFGLVIGGSTSQPFEQSFSIDPGQALTLYSDGIVENVTLDVGDVVGDERFHDVLKRRIEPAVGAPQQRRHVARSVVDDLLGLTGTVLRDDATIMVLQRPRTSGTD